MDLTVLKLLRAVSQDRGVVGEEFLSETQSG